MLSKVLSEIRIFPPYDYIISGLLVRSEVRLNSATSFLGGDRAPDVIIHPGSIPEHLALPLRSGTNWEAGEGVFLLRVAGVVRARIEGGTEIVFETETGHDPGALTLYLLGTCFAILLQQRGNVVLHASAVVVDSHAMLFCGPSGAGKSTMAAMLCQRGYALLNDDVCNLTATPEGRYQVHPDGRMLKLWSGSLDQLDLHGQRGDAVRNDIEKYFLLPETTDHEAHSVGGIYILRRAVDDEAPSVKRLSALEGMVELQRNAYRPALVAAMALNGLYFQTSATMQRTAGVYLLTRSLDFSRKAEVIQILEDHWTTIGLATTLGQ